MPIPADGSMTHNGYLQYYYIALIHKLEKKFSIKFNFFQQLIFIKNIRKTSLNSTEIWLAID